jgi:hypothetical protein
MSTFAHISSRELALIGRGCGWARLVALTLGVAIVSCLFGAITQLSDLVSSQTINIGNLFQAGFALFNVLLWTLATLFAIGLPFTTSRWSHAVRAETKRRTDLDPKDPIHSLDELPLVVRLTQIGGSLASPPPPSPQARPRATQNQRFFE